MNPTVFKDSLQRELVPYRNKNNIIQKCVFIIIFVFSFLFVFKPFSLKGFPFYAQIIFNLSYAVLGATAFYITYLLFSYSLNHKRWTVLKEVLFCVVCILIIWGFIFSFTLLLEQLLSPKALSMALDFKVPEPWLVQSFFFSVTFFIISYVFTMRVYNTKEESFSEKSNHVKTGLTKHRHPHEDLTYIVFEGRNKGEYLKILLSEFLYAKSDTHYIDVLFFDSTTNTSKQYQLRNSLKEIEDHLSPHQSIYRCHKSYLVNLDNVLFLKKTNSNTNHLVIKHLKDEEIPVAKNKVALIKTLIKK